MNIYRHTPRDIFLYFPCNYKKKIQLTHHTRDIIVPLLELKPGSFLITFCKSFKKEDHLKNNIRDNTTNIIAKKGHVMRINNADFMVF